MLTYRKKFATGINFIYTNLSWKFRSYKYCISTIYKYCLVHTYTTAVIKDDTLE